MFSVLKVVIMDKKFFLSFALLSLFLFLFLFLHSFCSSAYDRVFDIFIVFDASHNRHLVNNNPTRTEPQPFNDLVCVDFLRQYSRTYYVHFGARSLTTFIMFNGFNRMAQFDLVLCVRVFFFCCTIKSNEDDGIQIGGGVLFFR